MTDHPGPSRNEWRDAVLASSSKQGSAALSSTATLVALVLANFCWNKSEAWPTNDTIAAASKLSKRSVQRGFRELERLGWIVSEKRSGRKGDTRFLVIPRGDSESPAEQTRGDIESPQGCHSVTRIPKETPVVKTIFSPTGRDPREAEEVHRIHRVVEEALDEIARVVVDERVMAGKDIACRHAYQRDVRIQRAADHRTELAGWAADGCDVSVLVDKHLDLHPSQGISDAYLGVGYAGRRSAPAPADGLPSFEPSAAGLYDMMEMNRRERESMAGEPAPPEVAQSWLAEIRAEHQCRRMRTA